MAEPRGWKVESYHTFLKKHFFIFYKIMIFILFFIRFVYTTKSDYEWKMGGTIGGGKIARLKSDVPEYLVQANYKDCFSMKS